LDALKLSRKASLSPGLKCILTILVIIEIDSRPATHIGTQRTVKTSLMEARLAIPDNRPLIYPILCIFLNLRGFEACMALMKSAI
jgi:hypothetical protein